MKLPLLIVFLACKHSIDAYAPHEVQNDLSNEIYNNVLLNPMIQQLVDYVAGVRNLNYGYIPDDVALVNTIISIQTTMFQLASFYSMYKEGTAVSRFLDGLAIEFESQRCDQVFSSKFPRERPLTEPWIYYRDSSYYKVNCELPKATRRHRREIEMDKPRPKITTLHRERRALMMKKNPPICGDKLLIDSAEGHLAFPKNRSTNYTTNIQCDWVIRMPIVYAVEVIIDEMDLEFDKECYYDSLSFYDGKDASAPLIGGRICGDMKPSHVRSSGPYMTIRFNSDYAVVAGGFKLNWTNIIAQASHPGFVMTSTIVIDQVGDLNIDTFRDKDVPEGERMKFNFDDNFKLQITSPSTCPRESNDPECYFETTPFIISKLISTAMNPNMVVGKDSIEILFDHVIQPDLYPSLYESPKYCITWDPTVENTDYGSWSRRNGRVHDTNKERTICRFSKHGIHALAAAVPPPVIPDAFQFSISWYSGLVYTIIWISVTLYQLSDDKMNIPDWLNINQLVGLLVFCGVVLSGMHLHLEDRPCRMLSLMLYYFGLTVIVWHLLKAAQFTGSFDKFFRAERNLFTFYLVLGWFSPFFIAGLAWGVEFYPRKRAQSCWIAMKGGYVWGNVAPTYFLVAAIFFLYYKGLKRAYRQQDIYNFPKMRARAILDAVVLLLFMLTWAFGLLCIQQEEAFAPQFFFCLFLSSTTIILCLTAKQKRRSFEREFDSEDVDSGEEKYKEHQKFIDGQAGMQNEIESEKTITRKFITKWRKQISPAPLKLNLVITGLEDATIVHRIDKYDIVLPVELNMNDMYHNEQQDVRYEDKVDQMMYYGDDVDDKNLEYSEGEEEEEEEEEESDDDEDEKDSEDQDSDEDEDGSENEARGGNTDDEEEV